MNTGTRKPKRADNSTFMGKVGHLETPESVGFPFLVDVPNYTKCSQHSVM